MSKQSTLRCAATLVTYNGFGSSSGVTFGKGEKFSVIMDDLLSSARCAAESNTDKLNRQRVTHAKLVSDNTGRVLREWTEREIYASL